MQLKQPNTIVRALIMPDEYFPGNARFPLLIYRQALNFFNVSADQVQTLLNQNDWNQAWVDNLYDYPHYHSNTHEVLVIISGKAEVQFGGKNGSRYSVTTGDVIIVPAGVAHHALDMSPDFLCIGAYPGDLCFDVNCGHQKEYSDAIKNIKHAAPPKKDPIFGEQGPLFKYWK